mmetsp:Transcript_78932/g.124620  ORF Transcript_78932/g.124620 Transcript_78932/m.124620 type:complete len:205 (+) Transcript_78932:461-1075(+)
MIHRKKVRGCDTRSRTYQRRGEEFLKNMTIAMTTRCCKNASKASPASHATLDRRLPRMHPRPPQTSADIQASNGASASSAIHHLQYLLLQAEEVAAPKEQAHRSHLARRGWPRRLSLNYFAQMHASSGSECPDEACQTHFPETTKMVTVFQTRSEYSPASSQAHRRSHLDPLVRLRHLTRYLLQPSNTHQLRLATQDIASMRNP